MAKVSKKPSKNPAVEIDNLNQFIFEGVDEAGIFPHPEPITHVPNVDMFSTSSELIIEAELPGVRKEDIEVSLDKTAVLIKALKFECFDDEKINYVCMERSFGRIFRSVEIPFPVDTSRIKAVFRNGVLTISLPRIEDKRSAVKKVAVETGE